jgi:hypothetical protein
VADRPSRRVFPEDLVNLVIEADTLRREALGGEPSRFKPSQRVTVEPFFNLLGRAFGFAQSLLPWPIRQKADLWLNQKLAGHGPEFNPDLARVTSETVGLAQKVREQTGRWPALLVFTSHPETVGPLEWLRFEVIRQGLVIANAVATAEKPNAWVRPAPQCFLAIDPYALDTLSPAVGGFYAGWMHQLYLAWDRQPSTQSWIQRHWLLKGAGYERIFWRLLRRVRKNPVVMVISGGLPQNARLLYATREFAQRLPVRQQHKRAIEFALMRLLMQPVEGVRPAERGTLPAETRMAIAAWMKDFGMSDEDVNRWLEPFAGIFSRSVPDRVRLINILARRLALRGQPLLMLGVSHRDQAPHVALSEPHALFAFDEKLVAQRQTGQAAEWGGAEGFTRQFFRFFDLV